ncbi:hypothetical protein FXO38_19141 [Capsicum annuum]|nr:hypothetical protein FXO38_19141 [Capsicum annuum]
MSDYNGLVECCDDSDVRDVIVSYRMRKRKSIEIYTLPKDCDITISASFEESIPRNDASAEVVVMEEHESPNSTGPIKVAALPTEFSPYPGSNLQPLVKDGAAPPTAPQPMLAALQVTDGGQSSASNCPGQNDGQSLEGSSSSYSSRGGHSRSARSSGSGAIPGTCYSCRARGHYSRECPSCETIIALAQSVPPIRVVHPSTRGGSQVVDQVFRSCVMTVRDVDTHADLIILDIVDFDGHGLMIISRGFESYLTYICDVSVKSSSLDSIYIVREFSDAFSTDLPGIPPIHDIEFVINLELDTRPISMAPYHVAPTELKE